MQKRDYHIDMAKGIAIISVILLHTWNAKILLPMLAPFHIWQAVPIFMILLGYNNGQSYERRNLRSLSDFYHWDFMGRRFKGVLLPFFCIYLLQILWTLMNGEKMTLLQMIKQFWVGGYGPGSYFIPLTLQAYLLLPALYLFMKKTSPKAMILTAGILNTYLELICRVGGIDEELYRVLIIRFIFALAIGLVISVKSFNQLSFKKWLPWMIMSGFYIYFVMYQNLDLIMERYWHSQHLPAFFWPVLLIILIKKIPLKIIPRLSKATAKLGHASFHIYLVQMFYFWELQAYFWVDNLALQALIDVGICLSIGYLFFRAARNIKNLK